MLRSSALTQCPSTKGYSAERWWRCHTACQIYCTRCRKWPFLYRSGNRRVGMLCSKSAWSSKTGKGSLDAEMSSYMLPVFVCVWKNNNTLVGPMSHITLVWLIIYINLVILVMTRLEWNMTRLDWNLVTYLLDTRYQVFMVNRKQLRYYRDI